MGYDLPPVAAGTKVYNVATENFQYARVFKEGVNKPKSPFILRADDTDYTATSLRDNVNTDWRTQERLNAQRNAGAGKGNYLQQMRLLFLQLIHSQRIMMELLLSLS